MVYDQNNQRVGDTYPRRAKQLVLKGRAIWQEDNPAAIRLVDMLSIADTEEDNQMEILENMKSDETVINDESFQSEQEIHTESNTSPKAPSIDLLMYLAKQNVNRRYNLIRHIILLPVVFISLAIITGGFNSGFDLSFYLGFFLAWGVLVLYKCYIVVRAWTSARPKVNKKDLVKAEYERLKNVAPEKIEM